MDIHTGSDKEIHFYHLVFAEYKLFFIRTTTKCEKHPRVATMKLLRYHPLIENTAAS